MESLIPIVNQLQDVFASSGITDPIPLPQIIVVGSQSSGKSSVLEHVVGKDFLPRGSGIVTRRPLIVQCIHKDVPKEYGQFEHLGDKKIFDFNEIRNEITRETNRSCPGRTVSPVPISLKIVSKHVVDLTLVDLPGLVKVNVHAQSESIVQDLRDMVYKFAKDENSLILAVTAGNVDIANSDALQVANEVDPQGERTIGVLTKLDLEDKGTNSMDVLLGKTYPLKLGYIGVVNRSQQDINDGVDVKKSLKKEKEFFENHPMYCSIADRMGTEYMVNRLHKLLLLHIQKNLPKLRREINKRYEKANKRYEQIKPDDDNIQSLSLQQIMRFSTSFSAAISGQSTNIQNHEIAGGARIFHVFENTFRPTIQKQDILAGIKDIDILTAIKNASGTRPCLFVPQSAFENLISRQVRSFEPTCHNCVDTVYNELKEIVSITANESITKYVRFKEALIQSSTEIMNEFLTDTHRMVQDLIDIEADYVNTSHPDFDTAKVLREADAAMKIEQENQEKKKDKKEEKESPIPPNHQMNQPVNPRTPPKSAFINKGKGNKEVKQQQPVAMSSNAVTVNRQNEREMREIKMIRNLCNDYLAIVRKSVQDLVPKAIVHFLVFKTKDSMQQRLIKKFYNDEKLADLFAESPSIVQERKKLRNELDAMKKALRILDEVRDQCL